MEKKRILIIGLTNKMGGVETFIYNTTIFSDRNKYEYDYLVHGSDKCVFEKEINAFYNNEQHIYFISSLKKNPFKCFVELIKFYRKNAKKYDYIHLETGVSSEILYVYPFILFTKAKLISHSHNGSGKHPKENKIFRPLLRHITYKYLACSQVAADWLFGKIKNKECKIINNGINTYRFRFNDEKRKEIRQRYNIEERFVIGHIGRFSPQKNHNYIVEIFKQVLKRKQNSILLLVGVGELEEKIKQMCIDYKIGDKVIFAGKQDKTEDYYSCFDVFLMPSLYEGLPIVGIEAQSTGLPCLFSDTIDHQILITDIAKMLPLNSTIEEWAEAVCDIKLNENRERYSCIINEKGYGIKGTINKLEKVYEVN